jgi:dihydropteroate synthase
MAIDPSIPTEPAAPRPAAAWAGLTLDRPRIMGILNVTPDSFSDGGRHTGAAAAVAAGLAMAAEGADIIDVGGESTRPGADPVPPATEQARVVPVIDGLARAGLLVSVDTRNAATMAAALDAGAAIVNDISGLTFDPAARPLIAGRGCAVVLMHMRGTPATMTTLTQYDDVVREVVRELSARIVLALAAGIERAAIAVDPGIGFAKTGAQSQAILRALPAFTALGCPLLVGVSRKSFIGRLANEPDAAQRLGGSLAAGLFALSRGAHILRVHDVRQTAQAVAVWQSLTG